MLHSAIGTRGIVTASHNLAAQAGLAVLRDGGNAIEAIIAGAAAIAVVYPHMNALGGDGFWLIAEPGREPVGIDACGRAGARVTPRLYAQAGMDAVPARGPLAANTVAGTLSGWSKALDISARWGGALPLSRLLEDAIFWAEAGVAPSAGQIARTIEKLDELADAPGFAATFAPGRKPPAADQPFRQQRLASTLRMLCRDGLDSFYRGPLARMIAADLARVGSPIGADDLARHEACVVTPLALPRPRRRGSRRSSRWDCSTASSEAAATSSSWCMRWSSAPSGHSSCAMRGSPIRRTWMSIRGSFSRHSGSTPRYGVSICIERCRGLMPGRMRTRSGSA